MKCPNCGKTHPGQDIPGGRSAICESCRPMAAEAVARAGHSAAGRERGGLDAAATAKPKRAKTAPK